MRTFFGIKIQDDILHSTKLLVKNLKTHRAMKKIRWIPSPNWHITLYFLGNASDEQLQQLDELTQPIAKQMSEFEIETNGILMLPKKTPRILSLSVKLNEQLAELYHALNQNIITCGFEEDTRPFLPHITIGRWKHALHHAPDIEFNMVTKQKVDAFHLYKSESSETGSVYTPVKTYPIKT